MIKLISINFFFNLRVCAQIFLIWVMKIYRPRINYMQRIENILREKCSKRGY